MKKLTFKVSPVNAKEFSIVSLIKEINRYSCRIYLDLENSIVQVENFNDTMIDTIIELINTNFSILSIDIDNIFSEAIIPEVNFENDVIKKRMKDLLKSAHWAIQIGLANENDIAEYLLSTTSEISMRYSSQTIDFAIGDIVDVNFGNHLPGETTGGHVRGIVCNLSGDLVYVVPAFKPRAEAGYKSSLYMKDLTDATYNNTNYCGDSLIILDKGRYIRAERLNSVLGKTKPKFFKKLLEQLPSAFNFANLNK